MPSSFGLAGSLEFVKKKDIFCFNRAGIGIPARFEFGDFARSFAAHLMK